MSLHELRPHGFGPASDVVTINILGDYQNAGYFSRQILEVLFRCVSAERMPELNSIFCDLWGFARHIENDAKELWWDFNEEFGHTNLSEHDPRGWGFSREKLFNIKLMLEDNMIVITRIA